MTLVSIFLDLGNPMSPLGGRRFGLSRSTSDMDTLHFDFDLLNGRSCLYNQFSKTFVRIKGNGVGFLSGRITYVGHIWHVLLHRTEHGHLEVRVLDASCIHEVGRSGSSL